MKEWDRTAETQRRRGRRGLVPKSGKWVCPLVNDKEEWQELPIDKSKVQAALQEKLEGATVKISPLRVVRARPNELIFVFERNPAFFTNTEEVVLLLKESARIFESYDYAFHFSKGILFREDKSDANPKSIDVPEPDQIGIRNQTQVPIRAALTNGQITRLTWNGKELAIGLSLADCERIIPSDLYQKITAADGILIVLAPRGMKAQLEPGDVSYLLKFRSSRLAQIDRIGRARSRDQLVDYRSIVRHSMVEVESYLATTGTKVEDEFFDYVYVTQFGTVEASYRGNRAYECSISLNAPFSDYVSVLRSVGIRRVTKPFRMSDTRLLFTSNLGNALLADFPDVIVGVFIPEGGAKSGWIVRFLQP